MAGRKVDLAALAGEPAHDGRAPKLPSSAPRSVPLNEVAPNPRNVRVIDADDPEVLFIRDSIAEHGQLQACTVVTRRAFLAIFPELEEDIGSATYVQVIGGRRRVALELLGRNMDISVNDDLAENRAQFVSATAAENIARQDYNVIEEALALAELVKEVGSGAAAARKWGKTPAWVTQRMNLLKLAPDVQGTIRAGRVPLRDVRNLHTVPLDEQAEVLRDFLQRKESFTAVNDPDDDAAPAPAQRTPKLRTPLSVAEYRFKRLGGSLDEAAQTVRQALTSREERRAFAAMVTRDDD